MEEKGYNGWKNYETWCVALWIDNDEGSYNYALELARDHCDQDPYDLGVEGPISSLSDALKAWIEEMNPLNDTSTMFTDLLNAALSEVDWYEIAKNYLEETKE